MKFLKFSLIFLFTSSVSMGNPLMFPAIGQLANLDSCSGGGSQIFSYTGSLQNFVVPAGCKYLTIKAWSGGGGGGATASGGTGANGGAGGYASGLLPVVSGQSIDIYVGGGGANGSTSGNGSWVAANGGGYPDGGGKTATSVGAGGGSSRIVRSGTVVMVAGAGGAGGQGGGVGAAGGGSTAANGSGTAPGIGGSQVAGGAGGSGSLNNGSAGGYLAGGASAAQTFGGPGGGGGYYGGGSGGSNYGSGANSGGGGGGSGYINGVGNSVNSAGSGVTPPNTADSDYAAGIGVGGTGGASPTAGGNGRVKVYWGKPDPFFANISLLLHMDGANGGTTFTDSSSSPKVITTNGGATTSTAVQVNGSAAGLFNGTNAYLTCPTGAGFQFPGDFTVEMWVYPTSNTVQNRDYEFFATGSTNASATGIQFQFSGNGGRLPRLAVNGAVLIQGASPVLLNVWTHIAVVRSSGTITFYVNGNSVGTAASATDFSDGQCWIGTGGGNSPNYYYGHIEELRVTKGVARYAGNFTPSMLFPNF